jgi:dethiobiotin synthetase
VSARASPGGCFVTGTDTGVGKTLFSAAVIRWLRSRGVEAAGFKPVSAGTVMIDGVRANEDVRLLHEAGEGVLDLNEVGPFQFDAPCAPSVAALLEGRSIELPSILAKARESSARVGFLVTEGVGGFCVPIGHDTNSSDIARGLGFPIVLVVGVRLGCLNHALLTVEAIERRHLPFAGWVANILDPDMNHLDHTIDALHHELSCRHRLRRLASIPWLPDPGPSFIAPCLDDDAMSRAFIS